jgi:hypothetical protein
MATDTVAQMTQAEFKRMLETVVEATVEQKLIEMFGDPDQGLVMREDVRERLLRQRELVASGERGQFLDDVMQELELE